MGSRLFFFIIWWLLVDNRHTVGGETFSGDGKGAAEAVVVERDGGIAVLVGSDFGIPVDGAAVVLVAWNRTIWIGGSVELHDRRIAREGGMTIILIELQSFINTFQENANFHIPMSGFIAKDKNGLYFFHLNFPPFPILILREYLWGESYIGISTRSTMPIDFNIFYIRRNLRPWSVIIRNIVWIFKLYSVTLAFKITGNIFCIVPFVKVHFGILIGVKGTEPVIVNIAPLSFNHDLVYQIRIADFREDF